MPEAQKVKDIGMKRAGLMTQMSKAKLFDFIASGLPVLMQSASQLVSASNELEKHGRASAILRGQALEEVSKILILLDTVRCPDKLRPRRIGWMMGWFYKHLPRLLYVEAQGWNPMDVADLQTYVDSQRKEHYLEGGMSEYIFPNATVWSRESALYADVIAFEDGEPQWHSPADWETLYGLRHPHIWHRCRSLEKLGVMSRKGLDIMATVWSEIEFKDAQTWSEASELALETGRRLEAAGLVSRDTDEHDLRELLAWQIPMYNIDFSPIEVSLEELKSKRDAAYWAEVGGWDGPWDY